METQEIIKPRKTYKKRANLNTKTMRYFRAKQSGKTAEEAKIIAHYSPNTPAIDIESTKTYQAIEQRFLKDHLQDAIQPNEVANKLAQNIRSDEGGTSNQAIKLYMDKVEPQGTEQREPDNVIIVIQKTAELTETKDNTEIQLSKENPTNPVISPAGK